MQNIFIGSKFLLVNEIIYINHINPKNILTYIKHIYLTHSDVSKTTNQTIDTSVVVKVEQSQLYQKSKRR